MATTDTISTYYFDTGYTDESGINGLVGIKRTSPTTVGGTFELNFANTKTILNSTVFKPYERWNTYQISVKAAVKNNVASPAAKIKLVIYREDEDLAGQPYFTKIYESHSGSGVGQAITTTMTDYTFGVTSSVLYTVDNFTNSVGEYRYIFGIEIVSANTSVIFSYASGATLNQYSDTYLDAPVLGGTIDPLTATGGEDSYPVYMYFGAKVSDVLPVVNPTITANTNGTFTLNYTFPTSDRVINGEYGFFKGSDASSPVPPSFQASTSITIDAATSGSISTQSGNINDIALVFISTSANTEPTTSSTGWTKLSSIDMPGDGFFTVFWKRITTASAESFSFANVSLATNAVSLRIQNASTTASPRAVFNTSLSELNPSQIYTNINNSFVVIAGAITGLEDTAITAPTTYTHRNTRTVSSTNPTKNTMVVASKDIGSTTGIENPGNFTGFTGGLGFGTFTIVIEPFVSSLTYTALTPTATTGTVTFTPTGSPVNGDKYWIYTRYFYASTGNTPTAPSFTTLKSVSGIYSVVVPPTTTTAPTLSSPTTTSVNIQNTANSNGGSAITRWKLERSLDQSTWTSTEYVPGATNLNFNQTQTGLSENTTYFYRLSASNTATSPYVFGTPTPVGSVTTGRTVTPPSAPTFTTNTVTTDIYGTVSVSLGWSVSSMGTGTFTKYQITRSPSFATPTTKEQTPSFYTDTDNLKSGGTATVSGEQYTYTVTVVTTDGSASSSITVNVPGGRYAYFDGTSWQVRYLRNYNDSADIDIFIYNPSWNTTGGWQKIRNN